MRKLVIAILILLCVAVSLHSFRNSRNDFYEILKINSASDFYVDFNRNKTYESSERVIFYDTYAKNEKLSALENMQLNYLAYNYAKNTILNKKLKVIRNGVDVKIILPDGRDYRKSLIEQGFVCDKDNSETVRKNLDYANTLELVSYNKYTHKYHKLNCVNALGRNNFLLKPSELSKKASPCKICHIKNKNKHEKYPKEYFEKYSPVYKDKFVEFYVTDYTKQYYPSSKCLTTACQSLLREINSAKNTIDFAIYGIDKQPEIMKALIRAQKRGVKIRWVFDVDKNGKSIYSENFSLQKVLLNSRNDIDLVNGGVKPNGKKVKDAIMHNKFFIFDDKKVWTGSANISKTDLSGFNANSAILIESNAVAAIYKTEFEKMYNGSFHQLKTETISNQTVLSNSAISVYFSPQDKAISKHLVPIVNEAKNYVYIPVFVITHKDFVQSLLNAKRRGVDVRVIVDATSASSPSSAVKTLRGNGVKVKTENRAGKMHMKSMIVDDKYTIIGSMNFTKSGEAYNDENVLIIKNSELTKKFKSKFLYFYNDIPDKWLTKNPMAESMNSINSCYDGIDNDFDGKVDFADESCNFSKMKK